MNIHSLITPNTNVRLSYTTWEGDGPPVVLVHGLASSMRIWDYAAPLLADRFSVVAYDQRGHGLSDKPVGGYDLHTMTSDLQDLIDVLKLHNPLIVGHSWGATIALSYAATHPHKCAGSALVDGGVLDFKEYPGATWEKISKELAPPDLSKFTLDDLMEMTKDRRARFTHSSDDDARAFFRSTMQEQPNGKIRARLSLENHMKILRTIWDTHPDALYPKIECPTLAVLAEEDIPEGEEGGREATYLEMKKKGVLRAQELLRNIKVVWMEDTIHDIPLHKPRQLADELISFFEG